MDEIISFFKIKRNLINLLTLGIMILGLPIGIKLAKEQQIFTARARNADIQFLTKEISGQPESCVTNKGGTLVTTCDTVSVRIVAPAVLTKKGPELVKKAYANYGYCDTNHARDCYNGDCTKQCAPEIGPNIICQAMWDREANDGAGDACYQNCEDSHYFVETKCNYEVQKKCDFIANYCGSDTRWEGCGLVIPGECGAPTSGTGTGSRSGGTGSGSGSGSSGTGDKKECWICDGTDWRKAGDGSKKTEAECKNEGNSVWGDNAPRPASCPATAAPAASPASGAITHYKIAENFTALEQAEKKPYKEGVSGGVITLFTFTDKTPGAKTVLVTFLDSKGRQSTPPLPKSITLVPQPPVITSFDAPFDMSKARINLKITGDNFGSAQGKIKVNASELSSDKIDNWNDNFGGKQRVLAHIDNVTSSQNLSVVLVRSDGEQSAPATYQVNVTLLSLGAKLFGRAQRDFDQDNVTLSIFEMVGVGTSAAPVGIGSTAPSFRVVSTAKEKVVIDKEGTISNIKTRLKEGANYIACILAPLSVRVCTSQFTAVPGNNIIQDFRLPTGDVNADGCINASDASICKSEWGLISSSSNKRCNFNRDNRVNVYEWSILLWSYNKCNAEEPKQQ